MKAIFLNFASNNSGPDAEACFALVSDDKTVVYTPVDHRIGDSGIVPLLEESLAKAGWTYQDVTHIACIVGPGGFTSLRMAVSLANVLADQLQIPAAAIHLSDLYRARCGVSVTGHRSPDSLVWFHSTKKTDVFVRTFGIADSAWIEPTLVPIAQLATSNLQLASIPWCGELIPEHREALASLNMQPASSMPLADVLPAFLASQKYGKDLLQPWYGRGW